jgi:hypothetical protein
MEAESQVVLNTVTEYEFQVAFKNGGSAGNRAYAQNETTSKEMASRPKVSSSPDGSTSPGNYGRFLVALSVTRVHAE